MVMLVTIVQESGERHAGTAVGAGASEEDKPSVLTEYPYPPPVEPGTAPGPS
jgi:hypothetical protein